MKFRFTSTFNMYGSRISQSKLLRPVFIYALMGSLWILFSDNAVVQLFSDPAQIQLASSLKGWFYVVVTSVVLYQLLRNYGNEINRSRPANAPPDSVRQVELRSAIVKTVLTYVLLSAMWILFSDEVVVRLFRDPEQIAFASKIKGWIFVALTSGLLYLLLSVWREKFSSEIASENLDHLIAAKSHL